MSDSYSSDRTADELDQLLLTSSSREWQESARVVAKAMVLHLDKYNGIVGDLFLERRLRQLGAAGIVEIDDPSLPFGQYQVRLRV